MTRPAQARHRVLLVSEREDERERYAQAFRRRGYCTLQAATPADACRLATELEPAVVIADVAASVCADGVPLVRRLRHDRQRRHVPVVILAGHATASGEAPIVERAGADVFVATPCAPDDLERAVATLLFGSAPSRATTRKALGTLPDHH
jgi:two-component system cell cycle response regulator DivK